MADKSPHVLLAERTIRRYVAAREVADVTSDIPDELRNARAGVFVSIKKHGELRGCIGTIEPVNDSIAQEIIDNAISASTRDPRFQPVRESELDDLEISVDVLTEPERISSLEELDPKRYGVIVQSGRRRGLLLPDLEGVDTVEYQVGIAAKKGGIDLAKDEVELFRFEVIRHY